MRSVMLLTRSRCLAVLALAALSGCLANSYEIEKDELLRLVELPPHERGHTVRAVQRFSTDRTPERAPAWEQAAVAPEGVPPPPPGEQVYSTQAPAPAYVYVLPPMYLGFGQPTYYSRSPGVGGPTGDLRYPSAPGPTPATFARGDTKSQIGAIIGVAIAAAVVATIVFASSEGARYDGVVAVHPHHPLHLSDRAGDERLVALDELTRDDVAAAHSVVVVADEGAGLWRRGRMPLDRVGFAWEMAGGWTLQQVSPDRALSGGMAHIGLGGYLLPSLGVLGTLDAGRGSDDYTSGDYWFARYGAEVSWLPIAFAHFHLGPRVGAGWQYLNTGGGDWPYLAATQFYATAFVNSEWDLTTRLGFSIRGGGMWQPASAWRGSFQPEIVMGFNVY